MPKLNPEWKGVKLYIGTSATSATPPVWTYSPLCAGIKSCSTTINEQVQQAFYMCGHGGANNEVTGIGPEITITGDRIHGDPAQDYIVGLRYKLGQDRQSSLKVEIYDKDALVETIVADCTIIDIQDFGGDVTALVPFSCKIRINGIPTTTKAGTHTLSALTLGSGTFIPAFSASKQSYSVVIEKAASASETATISATPADENDTVTATANGVNVPLTASGSAMQGSVTIPSGTSGSLDVQVYVKGSDGNETTYILNVVYTYSA